MIMLAEVYVQSPEMRWLALAFVVAVAALFHGSFVSVPVRFNGDAATYIRPAEELARNHRFYGPNPMANSLFRSPERGGPETIRTPGYPLFLAAILALGLPLAAAVAIQHLLAAALAAATYLAVKQRMAATIAGLLVATQPAILVVAHQYMSDVLAAAVVAAALFCLHRRWTIAAGLLAGCATLVRPIAIGWFVPLALIIAMRSKRGAAAFALAAILLPGAWIARNYAAAGVPTISSIAGENMLFFRAGGVLALREQPLAFRLFALQQPSGFALAVDRLKPPLAEQAWAEARRDGLDPRSAHHAVLARYYSRLGRRIVVRHLDIAAELAVSALVETFFYTYAREAAWWVSGGSPLLALTIVCAILISSGISTSPRSSPSARSSKRSSTRMHARRRGGSRAARRCWR